MKLSRGHYILRHLFNQVMLLQNSPKPTKPSWAITEIVGNDVLLAPGAAHLGAILHLGNQTGSVALTTHINSFHNPTLPAIMRL